MSSLTKQSVSIKQVDKQEKKITAVVTAPTLDRDKDIIDTNSLKLPLKGGGLVRASELTEEHKVLVPFMLDHAWSVASQIGSGQKAWVNEIGELVMEFVFSSRDIAQDVFTLIEEGHIDNSFSITVMYDENGVEPMGEGIEVREGEIVEVSLVFKGSNRNARLLEVQKRLEAKVPSSVEEAKKVEEPEVVEAKKEVAEETEQTEETEVTKEVQETEETEDSEEQSEESTEDSEESKEEETNETKEKSMSKDTVTDAVVEKTAAQPVQEEQMDKYEFAAKQFVAWVNKDHETLSELNTKALQSYISKDPVGTHNTAATADGGAIVPSAELLADIYSTLDEYSTVANDLRVITLTEGNALDVATLVSDVIVNEVDTEGGDKDVTKLVFGDDEVALREFAGVAIVTKKLVRQAAVNVFDILRQSFARAIANRRAILALTDTDSGIVNKNGVVEVTASGASVEDYTWNDVKRMPYQVPTAAVQGGKYYISRELLEQLDTLKVSSTDDRDLDILELSGDGLSGRFKNGFEFAVEEVLGDDSTHAVFGAMGRYGILLRQATVESETFDQGTVEDDSVTHNLIQQNKLAHRVAFYENVGYPLPGAFAILVDGS